MTPSPLQLGRYFVTECHLTANKQFKPGEGIVLDAKALEVQPTCVKARSERQWEVALRVKFQPGPEVNTPYFFMLEVVGFFEIMPQYPADKIDALIRVNGPSVLYGVVREVVRQMTGRGPYPSVFLPSVTFVGESAESGLPGLPAGRSMPPTTVLAKRIPSKPRRGR